MNMLFVMRLTSIGYVNISSIIPVIGKMMRILYDYPFIICFTKGL